MGPAELIVRLPVAAPDRRSLWHYLQLEKVGMALPIGDVLQPRELSLCLFGSALEIWRLVDKDRSLKAFERLAVRADEIVEECRAIPNHGFLWRSWLRPALIQIKQPRAVANPLSRSCPHGGSRGSVGWPIHGPASPSPVASCGFACIRLLAAPTMRWVEFPPSRQRERMAWQGAYAAVTPERLNGSHI